MALNLSPTTRQMASGATNTPASSFSGGGGSGGFQGRRGPPTPRTPTLNQRARTSVGQGFQAAAAQHAPRLMGLGQQRTGLQSQMNWANQQHDLAARQAREQHGLAMRGLGLDRQNLGHQRDLLGLQHQGLGLDMDDIALQRRALGLDREEQVGLARRSLDLDRRGIGVDRGHINQMMTLADTALDHALGGIDRGEASTIRGIESDFTARGAWFAPGHGIEQTETQMEAEAQREAERLARQEAQAGFDRDLAHLDIDEEALGIESDRIDINERRLGLQGEALDIEAQRVGLRGDQLRIAERQLQAQAGQLGLNADRLRQDLRHGLESLGLDNTMTVEQLMFGINDTRSQQGQTMLQIMNDALALSGNTNVARLMGMATRSTFGR